MQLDRFLSWVDINRNCNTFLQFFQKMAFPCDSTTLTSMRSHRCPDCLLLQQREICGNTLLQRVTMDLPGSPPRPYWSPFWICTQRSTCQWSFTSICSYLILRAIPCTSNPWNKCPKRGLLTTGGQIPIEKHYRSFIQKQDLTHLLVKKNTHTSRFLSFYWRFLLPSAWFAKNVHRSS